MKILTYTTLFLILTAISLPSHAQEEGAKDNHNRFFRTINKYHNKIGVIEEWDIRRDKIIKETVSLADLDSVLRNLVGVVDITQNYESVLNSDVSIRVNAGLADASLAFFRSVESLDRSQDSGKGFPDPYKTAFSVTRKRADGTTYIVPPIPPMDMPEYAKKTIARVSPSDLDMVLKNMVGVTDVKQKDKSILRKDIPLSIDSRSEDASDAFVGGVESLVRRPGVGKAVVDPKKNVVTRNVATAVGTEGESPSIEAILELISAKPVEKETTASVTENIITSVVPTTKPSTKPTTKPTTAPNITPSTRPTTKPIEPATVATTEPLDKPTTMPTTRPTTKPVVSAVAPTTRPTTKPSTTPGALSRNFKDSDWKLFRNVKASLANQSDKAYYKKYSLIIGLFTSFNNADYVKKTFVGMGERSFVLKSLSSETYYVVLGSFDTETEAVSKLDDVIIKYTEGLSRTRRISKYGISMDDMWILIKE